VAALTLSTGRDELRARGFDGLSDLRCNYMLNAGKNALEDHAPWPWLDASTSGAAPLTVTDLKAVLHVWNTTTNVSLEGADRRWLRDTYGPDLTITGTGCHWYLDGLTTVRVFPADVSVIDVDYVKFSPELSADADTPLFPERLHPIWIDLAVVEAYMDSDEPGQAQALQAKVDVRLAREVDVFFGRNLQNSERQTMVYGSLDA
jgi:hypothetical protein